MATELLHFRYPAPIFPDTTASVIRETEPAMQYVNMYRIALYLRGLHHIVTTNNVFLVPWKSAGCILVVHDSCT